MAKAKVREIARKPIRRYKLTLSEREAEAVVVVLAYCTHTNAGTPGEHALSVIRALEGAGVEWYTCETAALAKPGSGTIEFSPYHS